MDFDDENEAVRAESFDKLVELLQDGNQALSNGGIHLFEIDSSDVDIDAGEYVDPWMSQDRIQALYTLVRWVFCRNGCYFVYFFSVACCCFFVGLLHFKICRLVWTYILTSFSI